jgi:hypothetical protein
MSGHWSNGDEPAGPEPENAAMPEQVEPAPPPPQPPVERVPEILEALFNLERDLTGELIAQLARCSTDDIAKLFGCTPSTPPVTPAIASATEELEGPAWMTPAERSQQQKADSGNWRWDANGNRIEKLPSAFPRHYEPRPSRPPGATWLSD